MNPIWVDEHGALVGHGPHMMLNPGVGPERFRQALSALRSSGRPLAFASFTFDEAENDSLVVIPHSTTLETGLNGPSPAPGISILDDGIDAWRRGFHTAMDAIGTENLAKVVLARQVEVQLDGELDPVGIVSRLRADNPDCYLFCVDGLIGASPELLISLRDGRMRTLALAGTATHPDELESVKISEEHRHVADSVTGVLSRHLAEVDVTEQVIVHHGAMSHVGTRIEGPAVPGTTVAEILADLHPTAAVAGTPTKAAIDLIREIEPGSRGRYAGPVGWMNQRGEGVFAIALRCGQVDGTQMTLFAGGGLVEGSEEGPELAETELKLAPMLAALGHSSSRSS
ncbi:MAG: isochorismate synthase MenF [Actinomycetota bacterium]